MLVNKNPYQTVVIHTGPTYITKFRDHDVDVNDLISIIIKIAMKFRYCEIESIHIWSVLRRSTYS